MSEQTTPPRMKILCVDFDGVIHQYVSPWVDEVTIPDPPVHGALEWLYNATTYFRVVIYSSRSGSETGRFAMRKWMMEHAAKELGSDHPMARVGEGQYPIGFTSEKPPAFLTIDDRCVRFDGKWSEIDVEILARFQPWNRSEERVITVQDIDYLENALGEARHAYLKRHGWHYTSHTPGHYWMWRRDFSDVDQRRYRECETNGLRSCKIKPFGIVTADTSQAIAMTLAELESHSES